MKWTTLATTTTVLLLYQGIPSSVSGFTPRQHAVPSRAASTSNSKDSTTTQEFWQYLPKFLSRFARDSNHKQGSYHISKIESMTSYTIPRWCRLIICNCDPSRPAWFKIGHGHCQVPRVQIFFSGMACSGQSPVVYID